MSTMFANRNEMIGIIINLVHNVLEEIYLSFFKSMSAISAQIKFNISSFISDSALNRSLLLSLHFFLDFFDIEDNSNDILALFTWE